MGRRRKLMWAAALAPVVFLLLTVAAWALDTGAAGGQVIRNVELAGADIGGLGSDALLEQIEAMNEAMADREVVIQTGDASYTTTAAEIGLAIDARRTARDALEEGRQVVLPLRPLTWLASFVAPREVDVRYRVDAEVARSALRTLEGEDLVAPVEPTIASVEGGPFRAVPGEAGSGIDADALAAMLAVAAQRTPFHAPVTVAIERSPLQPRFDDAVAEAAAVEANELTGTPLAITAGDRVVHLVPRELRALVEVQHSEDGIGVRLDPETVLAVLTGELADLERPARSARFSVVDGRVRLEPSVTGISCCDPSVGEKVADAFAAGVHDITIDLTETEPELTTEQAEALGIVEEVGSPDAFGPTTRHACCQNRVTNIHRIADIVRGAIIRPGETFSINDYVGRRTIEKGFVSDGVIYDGVLTEDVGGGVSQFATTLFNAALYAGLDFGAYQSHSLYISRYPRGHEATISYPAPDLQIVNNTPYGVLIWPEYTDTSITVRLFSTDHMEVAVGEPTSRPQGNCTRWTTPRTRTYEDGSTDEDSVFAVYRPEEGVDC